MPRPARAPSAAPPARSASPLPLPSGMADSRAGWRETLLLGCTLAILALVLVQSLVTILPVMVWDIDPRRLPPGAAVTELTPAPMAWINLLGVLVAALAM